METENAAAEGAKSEPTDEQDLLNWVDKILEEIKLEADRPLGSDSVHMPIAGRDGANRTHAKIVLSSVDPIRTHLVYLLDAIERLPTSDFANVERLIIKGSKVKSVRRLRMFFRECRLILSTLEHNDQKNSRPKDPLAETPTAKRSPKRGRRKGSTTSDPEHDRRVFEAWANGTGQYKNLEELAHAFGIEREDARLAKERHRDRLRGKSGRNSSEKPRQ